MMREAGRGSGLQHHACGDRGEHVGVHILVTLCRFDSFRGLGSFLGPFIPCERRLAILGNLEIQGREFGTAF